MKTSLVLLAILLASTAVLAAPHRDHGHHHGQTGAGGTSFEPANPHGQGGTSWNPSNPTGGTSFDPVPVDNNHGHQHTSHAQQG